MSQVEATLIWAAGICAAIATIWGLVNKISAALKKPVNDLAEVVDSLSKRMDDLENTARKNAQRLGDGDHSFEIQAQMNKHMLHSMSLLLKHCADGNHSGQLQKQAEILDDFIASKAGEL